MADYTIHLSHSRDVRVMCTLEMEFCFFFVLLSFVLHDADWDCMRCCLIRTDRLTHLISSREMCMRLFAPAVVHNDYYEQPHTFEIVDVCFVVFVRNFPQEICLVNDFIDDIQWCCLPNEHTRIVSEKLINLIEHNQLNRALYAHSHNHKYESLLS